MEAKAWCNRRIAGEPLVDGLDDCCIVQHQQESNQLRAHQLIQRERSRVRGEYVRFIMNLNREAGNGRK